MSIRPTALACVLLVATCGRGAAAQHEVREATFPNGEVVITNGIHGDNGRLVSGTVVRKDRTGLPSELISWLDGKKHGPYIGCDQQGRTQMMGQWKDGYPAGQWVEYNLDGSEKRRWVETPDLSQPPNWRAVSGD